MSDDWRNEPAATHRCIVCGALWRFWRDGEGGMPAGFGDSWNLRSSTAGTCCESDDMSANLTHLTMGDMEKWLRARLAVDEMVRRSAEFVPPGQQFS